MFFFFSSRRRHTRLQGDWSSDVCSSDLVSSEVPMTVPGPVSRCGSACALALSTLILITARPLDGQLISIKTVPVAQGDQFDIFPSQHRGMGGASIALAATLLDPFRSPARR